MRISKVKTVLKYQKTCLPILCQGVQINNKEVLFSNLKTFVLIENLGEIGSTYGIDKEMFKQNNTEDSKDFIKTPKHYESVKEFKLSDDFKEKINRLLNFTGNDDLRPTMRGICLSSEFLTATDAHILGDFKHDLSLPGDFELIMNRDFCEFLANADSLVISEKIEGKANFKVAECNLIIDGKKAKVLSKPIDGIYPKYKSVIPEVYEYNKCIELDSAELKELIKSTKRVGKDCIVSFNDTFANLYKPKNNNKDYIKEGDFSLSITDKQCNTRDSILMPTQPVLGQPSINPYILERACKGAYNIRLYFNPNALNRAFILELEYKTVKKKRKSVAELEAIINNLTKENSKLKQLLEGAI